jgi:hypothetical protein
VKLSELARDSLAKAEREAVQLLCELSTTICDSMVL